MKRIISLGFLALLLSLTLLACGEDASPTLPARAVTPFTPASNITIGNTTPTLHLTERSIAAIITPTFGSTELPATFLPTVTSDASVPQTPTPDAGPPSVSIARPFTPTSLPVYAGLKPINLGTLTTQITQQFGPGGPDVKITTYATSDNFSKLTTFYDQALTDQGYRQDQSRDLPTGTLLNGKIVLYSRSSGPNLDGIVIINFGPLDGPTLAAFAANAPEVANLKAGSNLVVMVNGLNGAYLSALQKNFTSGGVDTPTPAR